MPGPEHYRQAEKHLQHASETSIEDGTAGWHQGQAQVHATLALAAATAMGSRRNMGNDRVSGMPAVDYAAWDKVCGVPI